MGGFDVFIQRQVTLSYLKTQIVKNCSRLRTIHNEIYTRQNVVKMKPIFLIFLIRDYRHGK